MTDSSGAQAALALTILAPSGVLAEPAAAQRALRRLRALGFDASLDDSALARYQRFAGDDATRLAAIHRVADAAPSVALALRGGYGLTRLLDGIQWPRIARSIEHGTRWVGHSDFTALHLAALANRVLPKGSSANDSGGLWAGPLAHDDFSRRPEQGGTDDITEACFLEAMHGELEAVGFRTEAGFDGLEARGVIWGGNLTVLLSLLGTAHWPRIRGGILFLEDVNELTYRTERCLLQLQQAGVLDAQRAVVLGAFSAVPRSPLDRGYTLKAAVAHLRGLTRTPILTGLPFGHVPTKVCLPVGRRAALWVQGRDVLIGWGRLSPWRLEARWALPDWRAAAALLALAAVAGCNNSPLPQGAAESNTLYTAMLESTPRHLDPIASYWSNDTPVTYQVYEPLYGYHYLKRPFTLIPKTATEVVQPQYLDKDGQPLPPDAPGEAVAESVYEIHIKPGILYQPHPAFAKDEQGRYRYHAMKPGELGERRTPLDFEFTGTREMVAEDYVYALKRHATTRITTPIYGIFSEYVLGLKEYGELIKAEDAKLRQGLDPASLDKPFLDFRRWPLVGATAPDAHTLRLRIKGKYPQWNYWMAMTFVSPIPWEADAFYAQPGMAERSLVLDRWPVGTGPYMLTEFIQDRRMTMKRNPNYRGEPYPCEGMPGDREAGLLDDCGKSTPFIDTIVSTVEKEGVPMKGKFRQGYYDIEVFERTDTGLDYLVEMQDSEEVRAEYLQKGFRLLKFGDITSWLIGFNMLDPVIGAGDTPEQQQRNRKLRQAISIAIDWEEFSKVFPKKGGETAMGPLPGGIFGSRHDTPEGVNPVTHRLADGVLVRRPIEDARRLLAEAGYPDGRDARNGRPLVINYDYYALPTPERKAEIDWVVKQFAKLGVQLEVRATDNNQFQDKVRKGKHQVYWLGWLADYPDAENFLFLLYGPNGKTRSDGENTSNYQNPEYDRLFTELKLMDDGPPKQKLIDRMVSIVQQDAPWSFGYFPFSSSAVQHWVYNARPTVLIRDPGRYMRIDTAERVARQREWNRPVWWPVILGLLCLAAVVWFAVRSFRLRERSTAREQVLA